MLLPSLPLRAPPYELAVPRLIAAQSTTEHVASDAVHDLERKKAPPAASPLELLALQLITEELASFTSLASSRVKAPPVALLPEELPELIVMQSTIEEVMSEALDQSKR